MLFSVSLLKSEKIRIHIDGDLGANYAGFIVADSLGYYEAYGIDIEFCKEWGREECPNDSVLTLAVMNLEKAVEYACNGGDIVNICQINQTSSLAFISLKKYNIDSLHNLSNKKVAVERGLYKDTSHLNKLLNIDAKIMETNAAMELLVFEGVDVIIGSMEREYVDLYFSGFDPEELNIIKLHDLGLDIVEEGIYTSKKILDSNSEILKNFVKATEKGWLYAKKEVKKTANMMTDYLKKHQMRANYIILDEELKHILWHIFPKDKSHKAFCLSKVDYNKVVDALLKAKIIKDRVKYEEFYRKEFLENEK